MACGKGPHTESKQHPEREFTVLKWGIMRTSQWLYVDINFASRSRALNPVCSTHISYQEWWPAILEVGKRVKLSSWLKKTFYV